MWIVPKFPISFCVSEWVNVAARDGVSDDWRLIVDFLFQMPHETTSFDNEVSHDPKFESPMANRAHEVNGAGHSLSAVFTNGPSHKMAMSTESLHFDEDVNEDSDEWCSHVLFIVIFLFNHFILSQSLFFDLLLSYYKLVALNVYLRKKNNTTMANLKIIRT